MSSETLLVVLIIANAPVYYLAYKVLFGNASEFLRCLRYVFTPDIISLFRGEWGEDQWASLKFVLWLGVCAGAVYLEFRFFTGDPDPQLMDPAAPAEAPDPSL